MRTLPYLVGSEAITICREGLDNMLKCIRCIEPFPGIQIAFHVLYLDIDGFGDEQIGTSVEVLDEALEEVSIVGTA